MQTSQWNGYKRLDFDVDGRRCIVVVPAATANGNPWIWRTEFFDAWPAVDIELLNNGFHVVYMDMQDMYGAPVAMSHMDAFYEYLIQEWRLASKTVIEGFSRGGLSAYNWAAMNPEKVACIYADAPVCDFKSWPGGRGRGECSSEGWEKLKNVYNLTEQEALDYDMNPVDNLTPLADAGIPLLHVCGDEDDVVPVEENTCVVEERYRKLGGSITVILKPGCGHHPHSLENPAVIVDFVMGSVAR